jgi:hypothetical protein
MLGKTSHLRTIFGIRTEQYQDYLVSWGQFVVEALPADFAGYFGAVRFGGLDKIEREKKR